MAAKTASKKAAPAKKAAPPAPKKAAPKAPKKAAKQKQREQGKVERLQAEINELRRSGPTSGEVAMGVEEGRQISDCKVCIRGDVAELFRAYLSGRPARQSSG